MRVPIGRVLLWVVIPALALRALTALHLDLRGPLHFHADWFHEHDHDDDGHAHAHAHGERHHHAPGDPTVVTLEDHDGLDAHAHEEEAARGWSGTMCVALVSADAWPDPSLLRGRVAPAGDTRFQTRSLGRLERPPRPASA
jgi:hypothetical protein